MTGISASATTLGNVGPGFDTIGPMASFAHLHPVSKVVLTLEMWIGRLEVLTVLVLVRWEIWQSARWRLADLSDRGLTVRGRSDAATALARLPRWRRHFR